MTGGCYLVGDHATVLFMDSQACYCIGAWLSVIILLVSAIDAHLRETESLEINVQFGDRSKMETDATKAIKMVIIAFFQNPEI